MNIVRKRRLTRSIGVVMLNLAAMMDIFTLLVFFLLVNTGQAELLSPPPEMKLPLSAAMTPPDPYLVISVTEEGVRLAGKPVIAMADLLRTPGDVLPALRDALTLARTEHPPKLGDAAHQPVTILGDKTIPYLVLKRVMASCQAASFTEIDLAIKQQLPAVGAT